MKQNKECGWCSKTKEIEPMVQGGSVHMICSDCGSKVGVYPFEELRVGYIRLVQENKALRRLLAESESHGRKRK